MARKKTQEAKNEQEVPEKTVQDEKEVDQTAPTTATSPKKEAPASAAPPASDDIPEVEKYKNVPHGDQNQKQRMQRMNDYIREANDAKGTAQLNKLYEECLEWYGDEKKIPSNLYLAFKKRADFLDSDDKTYVPNIKGEVPNPPEDERKWRKVTHEEAVAADNLGKLAGYDRRRGLAYIID